MTFFHARLPMVIYQCMLGVLVPGTSLREPLQVRILHKVVSVLRSSHSNLSCNRHWWDSAISASRYPSDLGLARTYVVISAPGTLGTLGTGGSQVISAPGYPWDRRNSVISAPRRPGDCGLRPPKVGVYAGVSLRIPRTGSDVVF